MNSYRSKQQQHDLLFGAYHGEEVKRAGRERRKNVVCPKPRRETVQTSRFDVCQQLEPSDWKVREEIFNILHGKGCETNQIEPSSPYFCGSPPARASNPLIHDMRFGQEDPLAQVFVPILMPLSVPTIPASPMNTTVSASSCNGCAHAKFGFQLPIMQLEGFDCLKRNRGGCGITTNA